MRKELEERIEKSSFNVEKYIKMLCNSMRYSHGLTSVESFTLLKLMRWKYNGSIQLCLPLPSSFRKKFASLSKNVFFRINLICTPRVFRVWFLTFCRWWEHAYTAFLFGVPCAKYYQFQVRGWIDKSG